MIESAIGILFRIGYYSPTYYSPTLVTRKELLGQVKQVAVDYIRGHGGFPVIYEMPCGESIRFETEKDIYRLRKNIPCPCGDSTHWLVKFVEERKGKEN